MNKIICDVCGTSYPETSSQCPICGYVKPSKAKSVPKDEGYVHVKGGRFSAANVQKRNLDKGITPPEEAGDKKKGVKSGSNMVLGVTAIVLLLVLIAVMTFFIIRIIDEFKNNVQPTVNTQPVTTTQSVPTTQDSDVQVLCQELTGDTSPLVLTELGAQQTLLFAPQPADTTDTMLYTSADETVATVDYDGTVTAVAEGDTVITVACGKVKLEIPVSCIFATESTGQTDPTNAEESDSIINRQDITLSEEGETWDLYSKTATVAKNKIKWTSEDETVAVIDGGIITAVGKGVTQVSAEYDGKTYSCTVRCNLPDEDTGDQPQTQPSLDGSALKPSKEDVTLKVDGQSHEKSFYLYLQDDNGNKVDVTWKADKEGYVTIEGNKITAVKAIKQLTVSTTYDGKTYKCIVRIN